MGSVNTQRDIETGLPVVSVLLPVRNGGSAFTAAIHSILDQTFTNFELLVIDDGSSDGSVELIELLNDPRLRLIRDGLCKGLSTRLNQGIALARGRYIARMDADDVSFPERFQRQIDFLESHPEVDLVGCRAVVFRDQHEIIGLLPFASTHEILCARLWNSIPLPHPSWMGHVEWFRRYQYRSPEVIRAEDQELLLRASTDSRYACLDEVLLGYRQGSFNLAKTLLARRTLLTAQIGLFVERRQWGNIFRALAVTPLKVCVDIIAALPSCSGIFFRRMAEPAPSASIDILTGILANSGRSR